MTFIITQRLLRTIVELIAAVLPASAPAPTADEVLEVTTTLVPEAVAACVNDCVLFRRVDPRHDPDGLRAGLADLDTCPVCTEPRYRKTFWYQQCLLCYVCTCAS